MLSEGQFTVAASENVRMADIRAATSFNKLFTYFFKIRFQKNDSEAILSYTAKSGSDQFLLAGAITSMLEVEKRQAT